ncbi:uncharacterized protein C8orf48 homolog [Ochotona princeps]|uniref:uncharacterized protein C8orf48 homolog n=1 Tax=Ochotona princeps TaxID=9978 RepID=UPI002714D07D|nr:uncharacterized protein C8orf48 homolog [Ochotona princeps]
MAHTSEETSRSFTDEVPSCVSLSSSGAEQPRSRASGKEPGSGEQARSLEGEKQAEFGGFQHSENRLSEKWISHLKAKAISPGRHQADTELQTKSTWESDEELKAAQTFCTTRINLIGCQVACKERKSGRHKKLQVRTGAEALPCPVPHELLNRVYFKNMAVAIKQVGVVKQHISSQCPDCNRKRAELAQSAFLRQKKTLLESLLLWQKLDEHLHTTDFLTHVGEAHRGLPRLSDDPRLIWTRLNEKSRVGYCDIKRPDTKQKM